LGFTSSLRGMMETRNTARFLLGFDKDSCSLLVPFA
jgi:hypothetical protein